jgi:hypothetical protein
MPPAMVSDWERIGLCWGGRYEGGVKFDTMHFEYGYSPADVARHTALAQQLLGDDPGHQPEDDMPYSEGDLKRIIGEVVDSKLGAIGDRVWSQIIKEYDGGRPAWVPLIEAAAAAKDAAGKAGQVPPGIGDVVWSQRIKEFGNETVWWLLGKASGVPVTPLPAPTTYTVVAGDTLGGIAKKFGVTVDQLVQWNGRPTLTASTSAKS